MGGSLSLAEATKIVEQGMLFRSNSHFGGEESLLGSANLFAGPQEFRAKFGKNTSGN